MKNILIVLGIIFMLAFFGCKKSVDPTVPSATSTPNAQQTVSAADAIRFTQTALIESSWTATMTPTVTMTVTFTPTIMVQFVKKWGIYGSAGGQFHVPNFIDIDENTGNIYITDSTLHRVTVFDNNCTYLQHFGGYGTTPGTFSFPSSIVKDSVTGILYVADRADRVQVFDSSCNTINSFGTLGSGAGQLNNPEGMDIDTVAGRLFIADLDNNRVQILTVNWNHLRTIAVTSPKDVKYDKSSGRIFVTHANYYVDVFNSDGTLVDSFGSNGTGDGQFKAVSAIAVDSQKQRLFVSDWINNRIQIFSMNGQYLGKFGETGTNDLQFDQVQGLYYDSSTGLLYAADGGNSRIQVFKIYN